MAPPELVTAVTNNGTGLAKAAGPTSRAYVTFLAGKGDYVKGVVGLAKGLKKVKAAYPLVVAILSDVPEEHREMLLAQGCIIREIEPVTLPAEKGSQLARPYFAINYCKLRLWEFVEYSKMIYMDSDIQVFDNIDHLFDLPDGHLYAVMDCLCEDPEYIHKCPDKIQWPVELGPRPSIYFNAGMYMFEPNLSTCDDLFNALSVTPITPFAEQDFLNMFFKDTFQSLPHEYNLLMAMLWRHPEKIELEKVKVVHYCVLGSKPWRYTGKEERMDREDVRLLVDRWWDIYNNYEDDTTTDEADDSTVNKFPEITKTLQEPAPVVHYNAAPSAA